MEGITGEENIMTDKGMRKHVYGLVTKMTFIGKQYNKIILVCGV